VNLPPIGAERERKVLSVTSDRLPFELARFREARARLELEPRKLEDVENALAFATSFRYGESEHDRHYGAHVVRVAWLSSEWLRGDSPFASQMLVAALLHNTIEKNVLTPAELRAQYGGWVASAVETLTPDRAALVTVEGKRRYYDAIAARGAEVRALKLFDKLDNIFALGRNLDARVRAEYLDEVDAFVVPIAVDVAPESVSYLRELIEETRRLGRAES
jgi:(p)ppGpp synthase/HD superfamily hydrolase